jgi:hypothetical protein
LEGSTASFRQRAVWGLRSRRVAFSRRILDWLFNRRTMARVLRREHVLCLGDSHVGILSLVRLPGVWFRVRRVVGATASGILNDGSVTLARAKFVERLRHAKPWQQILLQLGEVDCGFVIWRRAEQYGLKIDEQLTLTLDAYAAFVQELIDLGFSRVIVLSVPLPTIDDLPSEWEGSVANQRKEIKATQLERTDLTLRYNAELQRRCNTNGVTFVDVTSGQLDSVTGTIDPRFLKDTRRDHHLAKEPYGQLISAGLQRVF